MGTWHVTGGVATCGSGTPQLPTLDADQPGWDLADGDRLGGVARHSSLPARV